MKKIILLVFFFLIAVNNANAYDFDVDGIYYNKLSENTVEVTYEKKTNISYGSYSYKTKNYTGDMTIPSSVTIDDVLYNVTSIGNYAFSDCDDISSIVLPDGLKIIGKYAFQNCFGLTSINIPDGVTSIGEGAFSHCSGLTSIAIPDGVTSIGDYVFYDCSNLKSINIPDGIITIGECAFDGCNSMTSVTIGKGITSIGDRAFDDCKSLEAVYITDLSAWCKINFEYMSNPLHYAHKLYLNNELLTSIAIPNEITSIGNYTFEDCRSLITVVLHNGVTSIGSHAFDGCTGLVSINIPEGVTSIEDCTFSGCSSLTMITIPNSVTSIGTSAFSNCEGLTSITIPNSVTSIGTSAFSGCQGLASIYIPNSVTSIGSSAFFNCRSITSVNIPDEVTSIGNRIFEYCSSMTNATIGKGVSSIGEKAFQYCSKLEYITLGEGITSIGDDAFLECKRLVSINIPEGVTLIGSSAFEGCNSLISINIPEGVTSIGSSAFYGCNKKKNVNITNIEKWMIMSCENNRWGLTNYNLIVNGLKLTDLAVPESITTIGNYSFYDCISLESITLHKGVTAIVQNAFNGCNNVKKIVCQGDVPPVCGAKVLEGISRTNCTLYVPETSGSNYQNTAPWSEFTNIVGGGTDTPDTPKTCEAPVITFDNDAKKLVFTSTTEGAECHYTINSDDINTSEKKASEATMTGVYTITAYASAEGMYNSEKTTAKLVWVSAAIEDTDILNAKADRGVIVSSNGNQINISGTVSGETIEVYNVGGSKVKSVKAGGNETSIGGLQSGNVYIVKIGGTKVKVAM